ncbi:MAG TPA: hypothetical protein VF265_01790 [Nevskiaceae bacterium]
MFAWLASAAASLLGKAGGLVWQLIAGGVVLAVLIGGPYYLGMRHQRGIDEAAAARLAQSEAEARAQVAQALVIAQRKGEALAAELADAQAKTQIVYRDIVKEVPHVVTVYREAPGAALKPLPRAVYTRGFVGLWNRALDPGLPAAAAEPAEGAAGADPALDSGLSQQQLLENHVDNAEKCDAIRTQLDALIRWHETVGSGR